jgi:hypothetical protein
VRAGLRRRRSAIAISAGVHLLVSLGLLLNHADTSYGMTGNDLGTGIRVSLVSGVAAGGPDAGDMEESQPKASQEPEPEQLNVLTAVSESLDTKPELTAPQDAEPTPKTASASLAKGADGHAVGIYEGAMGANDTKGGGTRASSDLLAQITRCLRPGFRPTAGFSQLTLSIGPDGRLRAPPSVTSALPLMSKADRMAADQIVQAAMLCGPYSRPDTANRVITLPVDFSTVRTAVASNG